MQAGGELGELLRGHDLSKAVLERVDKGRVAMLREVSRGVRANVDAVRGARTIRLNEPWFAGLTGTPAQKRQRVAGLLAELVATGAVIKELVLPRAGLDGTEAGLAAAMTPALARLELQGNGIGGAGVHAVMMALQGNRRLTYLDLSANNDNEVGSGALGRLLAHRPLLTHLLLADCEMEAADAASLAPALRCCRALTLLDLSGNFAEVDSVGPILPTLALMRGLKSLDLRGCFIQDVGALKDALAPCRALVHVNLEHCGMRAGFGRLNELWAQLPALAWLNVHGNSADDEDVAGLARELRQCPALRQLYVGENEVGDAATGALAGALEACPWITRLDVRLSRWREGEWMIIRPAFMLRLRAAWGTRRAEDFVY